MSPPFTMDVGFTVDDKRYFIELTDKDCWRCFKDHDDKCNRMNEDGEFLYSDKECDRNRSV
jgi:hypothetical protein